MSASASSSDTDTSVTKQGDSHKSTVAGSVIVTKYARQITEQQIIPPISAIPKLSEHQTAASSHSQDWLDKIWPKIISLTADIIDYANTFQSLYSQLGGLVDQLHSKDKEVATKAKKDFTHALEAVLIVALEEKFTTAKNVAKSTESFHHDFEPLYKAFDSDFAAASKVIAADRTDILDDQVDLLAWKAKANSYEYAAIGAAVAIPATATATAVFAETGVGLIVGGILIGVELAALATMLGLYADAMHHVHDLTNDINTKNTQIAQLTLIKHQITGLRSASLQVVDFSAKVKDGWLLLKDDMQKTIGHLNKIDPSDIPLVINSELGSANKEWGAVLVQAQKLQPDGGQVPSKKFSTSSDMLKAIDDQAAKAKGA